MTPYKLYIQPLSYNGRSYFRGTTRDTFESWGIVCSKSAFRYYGDPKDVASRNWLDEHGEDVYIPSAVKVKKFDAEFTFLCNGPENVVKYNVRQFHRFLMGMSWTYKDGRSDITVSAEGARLALYDTYNSLGWKDVRLKSFSTDGLVMDNSDDEIVLEFKVVCEVFDPYSAVSVALRHGTSEIDLVWTA